MDDDQHLLDSIRIELQKFFRKNQKYGLSEPLLFSEIKLLVNKAYDTRTESIYKKRGLSKADAFQDAVVHLLEERGGVPAGYIQTVYFDYYDRNHAINEPYTLAQSRKAMKKIVQQAFLQKTNRSIAQNVVRRALALLAEPPYKTHFETGSRRFTFDGRDISHLDLFPTPDDLSRAVRFAANIPKIPQVDHAQRMNKVFHTPDLHLVLQLILEHAPGLNISQLHKVFEDLLTDRPTANVFTTENMNLITETNSNTDELGAESAALIRSVAREIWDSTDHNTRVILSCQFSGLPDVKIAENISFDPDDLDRRRSRAWVTTKFTSFGENVMKAISGLDVQDQLRISRLIESHIVNFDSEKI